MQKIVNLKDPDWKQILGSTCINSTGIFYEAAFCLKDESGLELRYKFALHPDGRLEFQFSQTGQESFKIIHTRGKLIISDPIAGMFDLDAYALQHPNFSRLSLKQAKKYLIEGLLIISRDNSNLQSLIIRIEAMLGEKIDSLRQEMKRRSDVRS